MTPQEAIAALRNGGLGGGFIDEQTYLALPDWVRAQYSLDRPNQSESSNPASGNYSLTSGRLAGRDGRPITLINDSNRYGDPRHNGNIIDRSQLFNDPDLGEVTPSDNMSDVQSASFTNGLRLTQLLVGLMAAGGATGLLGGEAAAAGAAEGAGSSGLLGGGGGMDAVTAAEWFGGPGAATNPSAGLFGSAAAGVPESAGLLERITVNGSRIPATSGINPGLFAPAATGAANALSNSGPPRERIQVDAERLPPDQPYLPPFDTSGIPQVLLPLLTTPAFTSLLERGPNNERPWYQNALDNPLQTIGRGMSLYNMGRGLLGNRGNRGNNNSGGGNDEKGGGGEAVPIQRGPWEPNPITAAQIQNFQYARPGRT